MTGRLESLPEWIGGYISRLKPTELRQLTRSIARDLQSSQRERVKSQQSPDGSHYLPRKIQLRQQQGNGRIRRAMFNRLMQAKWLKAKNNSVSVTIEFIGRVQHMASVHQFGLRDKVERGNEIEYTYPIRELLGLTAEDRKKIGETVLSFVAGKN